ncbi:MAG: trifunctional histidinol dehydrogenase [Vezdaea aestivalis]|nr:MAG: trifunctional histidinol dehydrogenase [Vezdaea aestivalis]
MIPFLLEPNLDSILDNQVYAYLRNLLQVIPSLGACKLIVENQKDCSGAHFYVSTSIPVSDILSLLDNGAIKVFVSLEQLRELETIANIDLTRIVLKLNPADRRSRDSIIAAIGETPVGLWFSNVSDQEFVEGWLKEYGENRPPVYVSLQEEDPVKAFEIWQSFTKLTAIPIAPSNAFTIDIKDTSRIPLSKMLNLTSDREDSLIPTIVASELGVALGLVYSSADSVMESLRLGRGVYHSRKRGLWYKGETSGDIQELVHIDLDCDSDCLQFTVKQKGRGFCHLPRPTCFGPYNGLSRLQQTLIARKESAPSGSYTARLFNSPKLLQAKIMEEAEELCNATSKEDIAAETADVLYFALSKCIASGVTLEDVERNLDLKSAKISRRKGDAKGPWAEKAGLSSTATRGEAIQTPNGSTPISTNGNQDPVEDRIQMRRYAASSISPSQLSEVLQRPSQRSTDKIMGIVQPIIKAVRERGDAALLEYTHKFEKATSLTNPVLLAPFPPESMILAPETRAAIDLSYDNIRKFHLAQRESAPLRVETMPGVLCSRFSRPIERVGLYVPGGTAVLPSTALMLGAPAQVAGCAQIVLATPPLPSGTLTPEMVYAAHKVGASHIVLAGGAQAVAALAYGTASVPKVDKILGPGNQFVTAAKMLVSNDTSAGVAIDMPAGPSEVLVVADKSADPRFVAADLLSQAEHGPDSQVVLIAVGLGEEGVTAVDGELHRQALALPRVETAREAIRHSVTVMVDSIEEAMRVSNLYAPEHLILQVERAEEVVELVQNAGSVFVGHWTPESVGDYSAGVNHSLPTYGYAKQYSGVNLGSYIKHITSSTLTPEGLENVGGAVMELARVEGLEAHRRAVGIRLAR